MRLWNSVRGRTDRAPAAVQPLELLPARLVTALQKLVDDELRIRERRRRADRFQQAGATASAAVVGSLVIIELISEAFTPGLTFLPASGDTRVLLGTLAVTLAIVVWNVLGWAGAREGVPFAVLLWVLVVPVFILVLCAAVGVVLLYGWSTGAQVPITWAKETSWSAVASCLLPLLVLLGIAIGTEFSFDDFSRVTSEKGIAWPRKVWWLAFGVGTTVGLVFAALDSESWVQSLQNPELLTIAFAVPFVGSGVALVASVPVVQVARQRWKDRALRVNGSAGTSPLS